MIVPPFDLEHKIFYQFVENLFCVCIYSLVLMVNIKKISFSFLFLNACMEIIIIFYYTYADILADRYADFKKVLQREILSVYISVIL